MFTFSLRFLELITLFIALPLVLAFNPIWQGSVVLVLIAVGYIVWLEFAAQPKQFKHFFLWKRDNGISSYFKRLVLSQAFLRVMLLFTVYAICTIIYIQLYLPEKLFHPINNNMTLWVGISLVYALLSVLPQEWLFRVFFFRRYSALFEYNWVLIVSNGLLFSLAHLMFFNVLVMVLTFFGGIIFSYTYLKTKSFALICIEHFLYGWWLYHAGLGEMLAFPSG